MKGVASRQNPGEPKCESVFTCWGQVCVRALGRGFWGPSVGQRQALKGGWRQAGSQRRSPAGWGGVGVPGLGGNPWAPLSFTCVVIPGASVPRGLWDLSSPTGD